MKYVPSIAFGEMSGSAKGVTAAKSRGRKYIRNRGYGGSVRTSDQASVKSIFKQLSQSWHSLTNAQILAWNDAANTAQGKSVLVTKSKVSGANLYMRLNYWIVFCGGTAVSTPPTLTGVDAPASAAVAISAAAMTFTLSAIPCKRGKPQAHHTRHRGSEQWYHPCLQQGCRIHESPDSCDYRNQHQGSIRCKVWCSFCGKAEDLLQVFLREHHYR